MISPQSKCRKAERSWHLALTLLLSRAISPRKNISSASFRYSREMPRDKKDLRRLPKLLFCSMAPISLRHAPSVPPTRQLLLAQAAEQSFGEERAIRRRRNCDQV